jgi:hypothetical protein
VTLSNDEVISIVNRRFVPVYVSNEDYVGNSAKVPEEERKLYRKILQETHAKNLSAGSVHLYFLSPAGEPLDSIHVAQAKVDKVLAAAKGVVEKLGTPEGKTLVEPRSQAVSPKTAEGELALHLIARGVPGRAAGFWQEIPGEDFIVYTREEWSKFLPPAGAAPGATWEVDREVALRLLNYFYPSTENNDVSKNEVEQASMKATLVSADRVRLDVRLRMKHPFYHKKDEAVVEATAVGVVDVDPSAPAVRKFRLATDKATYNGGTFGVAVRSIP